MNDLDKLKQEPIENEVSSTSSSYSKPSQPTEAPRYDRPVPGSTLRCLEDPVFESDINSPPMNRSIINPINDEMEKARDRFDRYWGSSSEEQK